MADNNGIPAANLVQGALGLGESIVGLINSGKTKEEAERLARTKPQYGISPLVGQDLSLAQSELSNSTSAAEKAYTDLNNKQFSTSLGGLLRGGGDVNSIGAIYGSNQEGRLRLAQMKDQLRLQRIQNLVRASTRMSDEQQTKWQVNEFAPWQDKVAANANARMGSQKQIWEGLNTFGSAVSNADQSMRERNQYSLPTYGGEGFNGYYASGVPDINYNTPLPNAGNLAQRQPFIYQ